MDLAARPKLVTEQQLRLDLVRAQHVREPVKLGREVGDRGCRVQDCRRRRLPRNLERRPRDLEPDLELAHEDVGRCDRRSRPLDIVDAEPVVRSGDDDDGVVAVRSTAIGATPEGASSSIATYDESMPKELKLSSVPSPKTSRPSPVTIVTRAPSLAGITA
jgi:hypothetical protein